MDNTVIHPFRPKYAVCAKGPLYSGNTSASLLLLRESTPEKTSEHPDESLLNWGVNKISHVVGSLLCVAAFSKAAGMCMENLAGELEKERRKQSLSGALNQHQHSPAWSPRSWSRPDFFTDPE